MGICQFDSIVDSMALVRRPWVEQKEKGIGLPISEGRVLKAAQSGIMLIFRQTR
jgi:hypothetical protein